VTKVKTPLVLAVDLGGTNIRVALISDKVAVLDRASRDTLADEGPRAVVGRIFAAIDHILDKNNMTPGAISIAAPGAIDIRNGIVTASPNLPGWHNIALRDMVAEKCGVPAYLIHDANAAALGEQQLGAGKGARNLIYLTVSTGIGGGIIIDGRLYSGASGSAGELGHMTIDINGPRCSCGNTGCLEVLASGKAVAREAIRRIAGGERSALTDMVAGNLKDITAEKVWLAAQGGDSLADEVISQAAAYLGVGLVNIVNIFNPEVIVIGGGMSRMGDRLLEPARQMVKERAFALPAQAVRIVTAELGDDAGLLGAAIFALSQRNTRRTR
jgi:glucokinase